MKKLLRRLVSSIIALKTTSLIMPIISFEEGFKTLFLTAFALTAFEYLLKPIAKLLFLPINILTLGTLRWVINVIGFYLVTIFIKGFSITSYQFPGSNWQGFIIPAINCSLLFTYIIAALVINLIITSLGWIFKK